jgi:Spy/CpxP family protein refolding chaperone
VAPQRSISSAARGHEVGAMKRYFFWLVLLLSLSANATVGAVALERWWASRTPPLLSKVDLTAEQRSQVMALRESLLAFRQENRDRIAAEREQLAGVLQVEAPDRAKIDELLGAIAQTQGALQRRVVEHVLTVRGVLRADQRPVFDTLMTKQLRAGVPMQSECALQEAMGGGGR